MQISTTVVLAILFVSLLVQLYYILRYHTALARYKVSDEVSDEIHPVSVIISARNEENNLRENLPVVLEQDYPDFEVVVVNDCSWDDSEEVLEDLSRRYSNLKVVTINEHERFKHGKKFALTLGIKASSKAYLLFTDADCKPASPNWLKRMQQNFTGETEIVLGYSPYTKEAGFVNTLIRFETFITALNYLSFTLRGNPYMGVGRNLAYKKELFFRTKGFASHMHIISGDDDLFVNQNATARNTVIEIHPEAQVWSEPKHSLSAYFQQKLRHLGAGKAYKSMHRFSLTLQVLFVVIFYAAGITAIVLKAPWPYIFVPFLIRLTLQLFVYTRILKKLSCRDLILFFAAFDLIYYFYIIAVSVTTLFKKRVQWR